MGKNVDTRQLREFQKKLERMQKDNNEFLEACAKELAARLLAKVIKRTPVGDYSDTYDLEDDGENKFLVMSDKQGGTLRKGWSTSEITKVGDTYQVEVFNDTKYASYVEYGHRQKPGRYVSAIGKRLKKGWVEGRFMLTISEQELQRDAPRILEKKIEKMLKEGLK